MPMGNTARKIIVQQTLRSTGARRWANWITPPPSPALRQRLGLVLTVVGVVLTLGLIAGILVVSSVSMTGIKGPLFMFVALVVCGPMLLKVYRYTRRVRADYALEGLKKHH